MQFYNKKAFGSMETVVALTIFVIVVVLTTALYLDAKAATDELEHTDCRLSIEADKGLSIDKEVLGIKAGVHPVPQSCNPIIIDEKLFDDADDKQIARIILERMRTSWVVTGAGKFNDIWHDMGAETRMCKSLYYFKIKKDGVKISPFQHFVETEKLSVLDIPLSDYVKQTTGVSGGYIIALNNDEIVSETLYSIYIGSSKKGLNQVIIAQVYDDNKKTMEEINKFKSIKGNNVCDQILKDEDDRVKLI